MLQTGFCPLLQRSSDLENRFSEDLPQGPLHQGCRSCLLVLRLPSSTSQWKSFPNEEQWLPGEHQKRSCGYQEMWNQSRDHSNHRRIHHFHSRWLQRAIGRSQDLQRRINLTCDLQNPDLRLELGHQMSSTKYPHSSVQFRPCGNSNTRRVSYHLKLRTSSSRWISTSNAVNLFSWAKWITPLIAAFVSFVLSIFVMGFVRLYLRACMNGRPASTIPTAPDASRIHVDFGNRTPITIQHSEPLVTYSRC